MSTPDIQVRVHFRSVRIYFGGVLHLHLSAPLRAVQSWVSDRDRRWFIEYVTAEGSEVMTDYDQQEKWEKILRQLDRLL